MKKYIVAVFVINALCIAAILIIQHWIRKDFMFGKFPAFLLGIVPNVIISASLPFLFHSLDLLRNIKSKKYQYSLVTLLINVANEFYRTLDNISFDIYDILFSVLTLIIFYPLLLNFIIKYEIRVKEFE